MNIETIFAIPGRIAFILLLALGVFAFGWQKGGAHVQADWDAAAVKQSLIVAQAEAESRAAEQTMSRKLQEAQNAATEREKKLRADADAARAAVGSLRDTVATLRGKLSSDTLDACRVTADAALAVFGECSTRLGEVGAAADGHASDAQLCRDAWPK